MRTPQDFKRPGDTRRDYADATGKPRGERLSEYFDFQRWPEKATKPVTRLELLAILTREHDVRAALRWHRRLWTFVTRPLGAPPATLAVTQAERARGEGAS